MDGENRVGVALLPAVVDDFLRPALDLGIAALHRVEVEFGGVGARGHGAGRAAAHADAHAGAAQLDQQRTRGELDLLGLVLVDHAQAAGNHDGLVVAAHHAADFLLIFAEVAGQVGTAELVVERRAAQRAFGHDLQRAGDVLGLAYGAAPELGDRETAEAGLGLGAAAGRAFVADLAAVARGGAGERRDRRGMVVRLDLHQHMVGRGLLDVARRAARTRIEAGDKALDFMAFHDRGVVRIGHDGVLGRHLVGVADHAEQRLLLRHAVDGEAGVEDLVAAMLGVRLGKHHQFHIGGIALEALEGVDQIADLIFGQRQAPGLVGGQQRGRAAAQHIDKRHGLGLQFGEQLRGFVARSHHRLGHAVVQQRRDLAQLLGREFGRAAQQAGLELDAVFGHALDALYRQAAVARDVGGFRSPGRNRAQARRDDDGQAFAAARIGLAVGQQRREAAVCVGIGCGLGGHQVHEARGHTADLGVDGFQGGEQLSGAERAQGVAALQLGQMQSHVAACRE